MSRSRPSVLASAAALLAMLLVQAPLLACVHDDHVHLGRAWADPCGHDHHDHGHHHGHDHDRADRREAAELGGKADGPTQTDVPCGCELHVHMAEAWVAGAAWAPPAALPPAFGAPILAATPPPAGPDAVFAHAEHDPPPRAVAPGQDVLRR
ncbi:MAG: hypothetical protein AB7T63_04770 [Planctomycetota bacterium]